MIQTPGHHLRMLPVAFPPEILNQEFHPMHLCLEHEALSPTPKGLDTFCGSTIQGQLSPDNSSYRTIPPNSAPVAICL